MNKTNPQIDDIKSLHHAGRLDEARSGYLALLEKNPRDVDVSHLLGLLCAEVGDLDEARVYLKQALAIAPQSALLRLHLANILKASGNFDEAVQELQQVIADDPDCAPAFNNLGTIFFSSKQDGLAVQAYHAALEIRPDYADAYYNLGLAAARLGQIEEACAAYRALIAIDSAHIGAHFQLGCLLLRRNLFAEAATEFRVIIKDHPHHFESLANLAVCYLRQGRVDQAIAFYSLALELVPNDCDTLFNLGVIHMQQGYAHDAVSFYLRAVKAHPDFYDAHHNLGTYYLMVRDRENALLHFREALRIQPQDESSRHLMRVLMQDQQLKSSSPAYIQSLFDSYADYYDAHMRVHLHYQVPEKLYEVVKAAELLQDDKMAIVDIGCGTGLCGELFKPYAHQLVGIDLSDKMLAAAAQKNIYDELVSVNITAWLASQAAVFDLALAGDVLVYFGELHELMAAAKHALKPGGHFAFNVEVNAKSDYALTTSGRFAHHQSYLECLAKDHGFTILSTDSFALRQGDGVPVFGYLCLWQA